MVYSFLESDWNLLANGIGLRSPFNCTYRSVAHRPTVAASVGVSLLGRLGLSCATGFSVTSLFIWVNASECSVVQFEFLFKQLAQQNGLR